MNVATSLVLCAAIPIGVSYEANLHIPIMGSQNIQLSILSESKAHIDLTGLITTNGNVDYTFSDSKFQFELSYNLQCTLDKYRCEIADATYNSQIDVASIVIRAPFFIRKRVVLYRKM